MEKNCELCDCNFQYYLNADDGLQMNFSLDKTKLKFLSKIFNNCLCNSCIDFLNSCEIPQLNNYYEINSINDKFKVVLKRKSHFIISIFNKNHKYPLFHEDFFTLDLALKNYFIYISKLKKNDYSIIKSFEALDEHYRRIFTRVKYELLFD